VLSREQACARFAGHPPSLVPGIGPKTAARLAQMGYATLGELAAAPEQRLTDSFGPNLGRDLSRRARFEHEGAVSSARKVVSESRERTFDTDISDVEAMRAVMREMAVGLCASLERHGRSGRTIAIKVRLDDWTTVTRARTIALATRDPEVVAGEALRLLAEYAPPRPVRLLGVRVAGLQGAGGDAPSWAPGGEEADQLALPV
jgi:DNA polymerase-4